MLQQQQTQWRKSVERANVRWSELKIPANKQQHRVSERSLAALVPLLLGLCILSVLKCSMCKRTQQQQPTCLRFSSRPII